ncbi:codanin-1, partial [Asbolus verrucosus]
MADILLNKVLNDEIDKKDFSEWLIKLNYQDRRFSERSIEYKCSRTDFVTFFLNFVHEEIGSSINDKKVELIEESTREVKAIESDQSGTEINKSHSFPSDLSSELDASVTSTPKLTKVNSEFSVVSYGSPISPIYKTNNIFTTPKNHKFTPQKSPLCLGDFIINKRVSSKKKKNSEEPKRRIKPTNLNQQKNNFHRSENSFNFNKSDPDELPSERNILAAERLKILSRNDIQNVTVPKKLPNSFTDNSEIQASVKAVCYKQQLHQIIEIYEDLLNHNFVLNLTSEIYFLISLLLKKQFYSLDWGIEVLKDKVTASQLFFSIHNVVYFAAKSLEGQIRILKNYDKSTIRLLTENDRLIEFAPFLVQKLQKVAKADRIVEIPVLRDNVCFNSDTDNRQNFPNDPSFHAFRKQRDLFYEILRLWEQHHLSPGFNYAISLGGKIRVLLNLHGEPTNFIHFSRLFKAQLLSTCRNSKDNCENFITSLEVDAQKLSKLRSRCVTKENCQGLNSLPKFSESEEFYKDFILVGANHCFNRHLADALIEEIVELNDTNFNINELDDKENDVDAATKKSYYSCVKSLRLLAKFLGFIETLPYKTDCNSYSEHLLATHLKIRQQ